MKEIQTVDGYTVQVDDEDYEIIRRLRWSTFPGKHTRYCRSCTYSGLLMHRMIADLEYKEKKQVDHRDGNGLNNQRANLRIVTQTTNNHNQKKREGCTSIYKGVSFSERDNQWICRLQNKGESTVVYFYDEEKAALYYDKLMKELYSGQDLTPQMLNFPDYDGEYPKYEKKQGKNSKLYGWNPHFKRWIFEYSWKNEEGKRKRHCKHCRTEEECIAYRNKYIEENGLDYVLL